MNTTQEQTIIENLSFERALDELEKIIDKLEKGDVALEESITIYERGEMLKAHCEKQLKIAEYKVEKIRLSSQDKPIGTEPLDPQ